MLGRDLEALIQRARECKKEFGDSFVSVEHLVLGFAQDNRFGKQLFKDFQLTQKSVKEAIQSIRGRQTVIDQGSNFFQKHTISCFLALLSWRSVLGYHLFKCMMCFGRLMVVSRMFFSLS